jgi:hypothetical protein
MALKVLTANLLEGGTVVFLSSGGTWHPDIAAAAVAHTDAQVGALEAAGKAAVAANLVVDPYLVEVERNGPDNHLRPIKLREAIRALGPTVRPDLAQQRPSGRQHAA